MTRGRLVVLVGLLVVIAGLVGGYALTHRSGVDSATCSPTIPPVDASATPAAVCAAATLDRWKALNVMGIGQQLDLQEPVRMRQPLDALPQRPAVVGFDFQELLNAQDYFHHDPVSYLADLADQGILLTATWHPGNPVTGGGFDDRSWAELADLLDPQSQASATFWPLYDRVLDQAARLQDKGAAVIFKPLHEASGGWFWWGSPDPAVYRQVFAEMQSRAYARGVHNLLWGYAANQQVYSTDGDPLPLVPDSVDLVGVDVYVDPATSTVPLPDYRRLEEVAPRMAITEVGPRDSTTGAWNPNAITDTLRAEGLYAEYAMLWRDDPAPGNRYQISSLTGGSAWLGGCPQSLCPLGG